MPDFDIEDLTRTLISAKTKLLSMVAAARRAEETQATRAEMRKRLISDASKAEAILKLLEGEDLQALAHIEVARPGCMNIAKIDGVAEGLRDLAEGARWAAKSVKASKKAGGNKRDAGSGRAWADGHAPSAKDLCAIIVREIFMRYDGGAPAPSNRQARKTAARIWAAAGGEPSRWEYEGAKATGWTKHFKRAAALTDRPEYKTIKRLLKAADATRHLPPVVWEAFEEHGGLRLRAATAAEAAGKIRRFRLDDNDVDQTLDARVTRRYQSRKSQSA